MAMVSHLISFEMLELSSSGLLSDGVELSHAKCSCWDFLDCYVVCFWKVMSMIVRVSHLQADDFFNAPFKPFMFLWQFQ